MIKKIIILVCLAAAAGVGYYVYQNRQAEIQGGSLILYGNVDIRDVSLGFRVAGRIAEMRFEEGDQVKQGTILAEIGRAHV